MHNQIWATYGANHIRIIVINYFYTVIGKSTTIRNPTKYLKLLTALDVSCVHMQCNFY